MPTRNAPKPPIAIAGRVPSPWLLFFVSALGGPAIAIATGLLTANVQSARLEERLLTVTARVQQIEAHGTGRAQLNDTRLEKLEAMLRVNDLQTAGMAGKLDGMPRDIENVEKRLNDRIANVIEAIRRLQDRVGGRPTDYEKEQPPTYVVPLVERFTINQ